MKKFKNSISVFAIWIFLLKTGSCVNAQEVKIFSKYNYYTTEDSVVIIGDLLSATEKKKYSLLVFDGEKLLAASANSVLKVAISLSAFKFGTTDLKYRISDGDINVQEGKIDIVRLKPKANEVKIDLQTGGLIADGLPFFPFGFYCRPDPGLFEQEVTHGFNMVGPYQSNLPATYKERKEYMDRCAKLGIKVQYGVNSLIGSGHNGARGLDMTEEEKEELLRKEIIAFRDHPALLSWYINDEPDGQGRPVSLLEKAYKTVHELDPYHPISIVFMLPQQFRDFRNTMDIAMTDPYPVPGPLDMVERFVNQMNHDFKNEKSIWLVPQAFGGQEMWTREPTAKEIRLMTYMGLINGVKGIQYFIRSGENLNPQSVSAWSTCSDIAVEVNQMSGFLLSDQKAIPVSTTDSAVILKSFSYKNDFLILAANRSNTPHSFNININGSTDQLNKIKTASLWFENREVDILNNSINDIIDALGTRVYLIKLNNTTDSTKYYKGNLTLNPGFEKIVSPGLPIGSNTKKSFPGMTRPGSSIFIDPRQSVEGMFSLRFTTAVDSNGNRIRLLPMMLKGGNGYRISVWAKAKGQESMPVFRIAVDGPGEEKTFTLSDQWKQYSFIVQPNTTFSSAIISLDLLTAGTAWFDMLQVSPDPYIGYVIENNKAYAFVSTSLPGATLKYNLTNDGQDIFKSNYSLPIEISKATSLKAAIFTNDSLISKASVFIPISKALGKPVKLESEYAQQYAASGSSSLTDGLMGPTAFKDKRWLGFLGKDVIATIDMQQVTDIHTVTVSLLDDPNSGIYLPPEILLYVSADGKDFKLTGSYKNNEIPKLGEPSLKSFVIHSKKIKGRYVKVVMKAFGKIPEGYLFKGTQSWIFVDEIMIE